MKYAIIMACALSAVCMNVQCMDDENKDRNQPLLLNNLATSSSTATNYCSINIDPAPLVTTNTNAGTTSHSGTNVYAAFLNDIERGVGEKEAMHNFIRSITSAFPPPTDMYTGTLYTENTVNYAQFWIAYNIPNDEIYRSSVQLDEYVRNRRNREKARLCCECCEKTGYCLCISGAIAGCITGLVYWARWSNSCDNPNVYNPDCFTDYSSDNNTLINVTQWIKTKMD